MSHRILQEDGFGLSLEDGSGWLVYDLDVEGSLAYGKFAIARVFPPICIPNMRGARPRIYMPLEDTTVRTGK